MRALHQRKRRESHYLDRRNWLRCGHHRTLFGAWRKQSDRLHPHDRAWDRRRVHATFIGQAIGWYRLDQGAGLIGATVGALVVLFIWHRRAICLRSCTHSPQTGDKA